MLSSARSPRDGVALIGDLSNDQMSPLFQAVAEATEEAVYNAMLQAVTTTGYRGHRLDALPYQAVRDSLERHGLLTGAR
jgi:D-aminopeptidase